MNFNILKSISVWLVMLLSSPFKIPAAETSPTISIAVFDFGSPYRVRLRNDIGLVSSLLAADLASNIQFTVVDRTELKKIMKEQAMGASGEISPATAAKIGRIVGAKILVTGQIFNVGDTVGTDVITEGSDSEILIVAKVIGTETSRIFSQREQGLRKNLVALSDDLSKKIAQTIDLQFTNLISTNTVSREERILGLAKSLRLKNHPTVSVKIQGDSAKSTSANQTMQNELARILIESGFEVVDEKSDIKPVITITGEATSSARSKINGLFSSHATVTIKLQDRLSGKILLIDQENGAAAEPDKKFSIKTALINATDDLTERILPALAH